MREGVLHRPDLRIFGGFEIVEEVQSAAGEEALAGVAGITALHRHFHQAFEAVVPVLLEIAEREL